MGVLFLSREEGQTQYPLYLASYSCLKAKAYISKNSIYIIDKMEGKTDVIERILASLPPRSREKNIKAVTKAFKGAEIDPFSYNFKRIKDSFNNEFIVMQYTEHPKREGCYRSPYTGFYEPGEVFFDNPLKDMPDYWSVEKQVLLTNNRVDECPAPSIPQDVFPR